MSKKTIIIELDDEAGKATIQEKDSSIGVSLNGLDFDPSRLGKTLGRYILKLEENNESK